MNIWGEFRIVGEDVEEECDLVEASPLCLDCSTFVFNQPLSW